MLTELSGGITVRTTLKNIAFFTATAVVSFSQAAPMSMLQSVPREASASVQQTAPQGALPSQGEPSKMGWLTKWMGNKPSDAVNPALQAPSAPQFAPQIVSQAGPQYPQMAYMPPDASSRPVSNAIPRDTMPSDAIQGQTIISPVSPSYTAQAAPTANPTQAANARTLREQGHEADRLGTLGEAERLYRLAMEADPSSAAAVNDLALCLARQGQLDSSAVTFLQAISMRPEKPLYRNNIATVLVEMGLYDDAKSHLVAAYPPATASYNLGHLLVNRGMQQEAINAFQESLAYDPNLAAAHDMLASLAPNAIAPAEVAAPHVAQAPTKASPAANNFITVNTTSNTGVISNVPQQMPTSATPSFPRLLPPVINR